ncbi:hypothetical protein UFOVP80_17 [uncultured Caudovirales phage]|jgi:hypothetical protein|uniref:Uncharacterized protein n=1 Tax=uncultured Caudovirales phage TaxID=2100421 RepID=A0A6J5KVH5_9CAUD|nr:hypothetical protein UFOVP80_17 [uncultured Caudovirales phage]
MSTPAATTAPYLPTSRAFPAEIAEMSTNLSKAWADLANIINKRTIGNYFQLQTATGNLFYPAASDIPPDMGLQPRQSFRQVYTLASIASGTNPIPANIVNINQATFVNIYGVAQSTDYATALMPWDMTLTDDAPYLRVNITDATIEIITNDSSWEDYSAIIVIEYLLT